MRHQSSFLSLLSPEDLSQNAFLHPSHSLQSYGLGGNDDDPSRWSNSQLSELRPGLIRDEAVVEDGDSVLTESERPEHWPRKNRRRPHSFSTISEHPSTSSIRPRGDYHRVVIHQSNNQQDEEEGGIARESSPHHPLLEVPIPHYRLGTPQFTATGSAALLSTQGSSRCNSRNSQHLLGDSLPSTPLPTVQSPSNVPYRPSYISSIFSGGTIDLGPRPSRTEMSVFYDATEPIQPSVFEGLASGMDDESVVRYVSGTKDISAASPARIVAQISSESFMDYELVSDFFLTFRSYLSPNHLLALLLARLQWAINRWQDDGRIIRIRTFAALRHWILNYFVDDFLPDFDLRVYFCDTINSMLEDVKGREGGGTSDLKILMDLKRCWHGKCAMCWDAPGSSAYYHPDSPIVPGGAPDILTDEEAGQVPLQTTQIAQQQPVGIGNKEVYLADVGGDATAAAPSGHNRNHSAATAQSVPSSLQSDQSFHVTSCSVLPKTPKRLTLSIWTGKAPHPVPLLATKFRTSQLPPQSSPTASKRNPFYGHAHKRSGSFSDSVRDDRAPLSRDQWGVMSSHDILDPSSLIRGSLYPPAESYTTMMAPPSPPFPSSSFTPALERHRSATEGPPKPTPSGSGVRTFIGSIRRALSSTKQSAQAPHSSRHTRTVSETPLRGKTSTMPTNVALGSDFYRERKSSAVTKRPTRIDNLCEEVLKQYRQAAAEQEGAGGDSMQQQPPLSQPQPQPQPQSEPGQKTHPPSQPQRQPEPEDVSTPRLPQPRPGVGPRTESGLTMGSDSIVIVDDTGFDVPIASRENGQPALNVKQTPPISPDSNQEDENLLTTPKATSHQDPFPSYNEDNDNKSSRADDEYSMQIFYDESGAATSRQPSGTFYDTDSSASQRSSGGGERGPSYRKRLSPSVGLRKYASYQSGISRVSKLHQAKGSEPVPLLVDPSLLDEESEKQRAGPVLRRRPGGDLRKMRNGRNQLSYLASRSSSSLVDSQKTNTTEYVASRPQTSLIPPNPRLSLMQTNSSNAGQSLETAMGKFAQIPDDNDGGIESTLLKLEGRWRLSSGELSNRADLSTAQQRRNVPVLAQHGEPPQRRPYSDSVAESEESFSSIPLLERGLSDDSMKKPPSALGHVDATPRARSSTVPSSINEASFVWDSPHESLDIVKETDSMRRIPRGSTLPVPRPKTKRLSQLSSELSAEDIVDPDDIADGHHRSVDTTNLGRSSYGIPTHPLAQPPSPPMTIQNPRSVTSCTTPLNSVLAQARPLTPDPSPRRRNGERGPGRSIDMQQDVLSRSEWGQQQQQQQVVEHVPFVLACESQLLAQQLTLVEMAALSEIDWRDLVDMRWSSGSKPIRTWVEFLTADDHRGIDVVIGRFNLMVKWVLSEIVLTTDINERVQTITKFIHTAAHAKRMCNYATVLQITIALSSTDCSRLERTWSLVAAEDRRLLKDMEGLIQPVRNFHDLRVEMETANLQEGCIPFVGKSSSLLPFPLFVCLVGRE